MIFFFYSSVFNLSLMTSSNHLTYFKAPVSFSTGYPTDLWEKDKGENNRSVNTANEYEVVFPHGSVVVIGGLLDHCLATWVLKGNRCRRLLFRPHKCKFDFALPAFSLWKHWFVSKRVSQVQFSFVAPTCECIVVLQVI